MDILTADDWGRTLYPGTRLNPMGERADYWVVHHTAGSTKRHLRDELLFINEDALGEGKTCIDYSFAINLEGEIGEGRGWGIVGAHTGAAVPQGKPRAGESYNKAAHAIVFIGNYEEIQPTQVQLDAAARLMAEGVRLGHVKPSFELLGHRDTKPTACPGGNLYAQLPALFRAYQALTTEEADMPLSQEDLNEIKRIVDEVVADRIGNCGRDREGNPIKRSVSNLLRFVGLTPVK